MTAPVKNVLTNVLTMVSATIRNTNASATLASLAKIVHYLNVLMIVSSMECVKKDNATVTTDSKE